MKKQSRIIAVALALVLTVALLCACNRVKPAPIGKITGVYKLERWERTTRYGSNWQEIENYSQNVDDILARKHVVCYIVIAEDGNDYYVYKDDETSLVCYAGSPIYTYHTDDDGNPTDKIEHIKLMLVTSETKDLYVQADKHTFTDNSAPVRFEWHLGGQTVYTGTKYGDKIRYKRISKTASLSVVESELGTTVTPITEIVPEE